MDDLPVFRCLSHPPPPFARLFTVTGSTSCQRGCFTHAARWCGHISRLLARNDSSSHGAFCRMEPSDAPRNRRNPVQEAVDGAPPPLLRFWCSKSGTCPLECGQCADACRSAESGGFERDKSNEMSLHLSPGQRMPSWVSVVLWSRSTRVTLSYFIEPNPARQGWERRHRYASHGLRFAVQKPHESPEDLRKHINKAARRR